MRAGGKFAPAENLETQSQHVRGNLRVDGRLKVRGIDLPQTILNNTESTFVTRVTVGGIASGTEVSSLQGMTVDEFIVRLLDIRAPAEVEPTYVAPTLYATFKRDTGSWTAAGDVKVGEQIKGGYIEYLAVGGSFSNAYTAGTWDGVTYSGALMNGNGVVEPAHPINSTLTFDTSSGGVPAPYANDATGPTWKYSFSDFTPTSTPALKTVTLGKATANFDAADTVYGNQGTAIDDKIATTASAGQRVWETYAPVYRSDGAGGYTQDGLSGDLKVKAGTDQIDVSFPKQAILYVPQKNGSYAYRVEQQFAGQWTEVGEGEDFVVTNNAITINGVTYRSYQNPVATAGETLRFKYN